MSFCERFNQAKNGKVYEEVNKAFEAYVKAVNEDVPCLNNCKRMVKGTWFEQFHAVLKGVLLQILQ